MKIFYFISEYMSCIQFLRMRIIAVNNIYFWNFFTYLFTTTVYIPQTREYCSEAINKLCPRNYFRSLKKSI